MMVWNGRLFGPDLVGVAFGEHEAGAAILQADAAGRDHAGAETHVVGLDEAHHHAIFIGGGEVDRAAFFRCTGLEVGRLFHVDEFRADLR